MAFRLHRGKTKFIWLPVTTSTAFTNGGLVDFTSGLLTAATSSSAAAALVGVIRHTIASTDADYATARLVEVEVPVEKNVEWEFDTSSLVSTDIGVLADLTDSVTVNRGASSVDVIRILRVISSTKGIGVILFQG